MKNKRAKQMICDVIQNYKSCGFVWWEGTHQRYGNTNYPNSILLIDGMNDIEYTFWYSPKTVSITASELNGAKNG